MPHAYKWREDGRLGVRPHRTGVLAMHACLEGVGLREPGRTGVPDVHACPEGVQGLQALRTGVHGQHACPVGPHAEPAVLTPFVGVRHAGVCTPGWEGVQPPHAFFLGVRGGVRTPFGRAAIKPQLQDMG
ncbi:hypothetical protein PCASD_07562 [Puccinia coronata f. sp. avenae]|uniref:Uncharacterized protein n=1 Tax=Puccinia coronata f. sp. avenae TaxID=200324 RepID=A0A2N5TGP0_9BASI|nr:hypothetical protein PCASD_07562 [Puccinia coronata f. sp. avenae]